MNNDKKSDSFIFKITIFFVGYMLLMIIILSTVWINTSTALESGAAAALTQSADIGTYEIDEIMRANEQALYSILQDNDNIKAFENGTETERAVAEQNMIQLLRKATQGSAVVQNLFFYDLIGESYVAVAPAGLSYSETTGTENMVKGLCEEYPKNTPSLWFYKKIGEKNYLLRVYKNKKRMIGALIDCELLLNSSMNEKVFLAITDEEGNVIDCNGDEAQKEELIKNSLNLNVTDQRGFKWSDDKEIYFTERKADDWGFSLYAAMTKAMVYGGFQSLQIIMLMLIVAAIIMLAFFVMYTRRVVYKPLIEILGVMKKIEGGEQEHRLSETADSVEFRRINNSFNRMLDTIVNLRMKSYEERIQFDEATLKYVQLQIKPHFFLNALTTIHSMSFQNRNEDIREYIEKLSENVRYLFKSGMHTVPLNEEIAHVRNYIAMQDLLYPGCVFDFIDIDAGVEDYPIPQLIIHTILENIYKHAVSVDKLTSILICARLTDKDGEEMCCITVEDDGEGYPEEFLKQVESGEVKVQENGHGVGLWNLKKTLDLMYRRDDLIEFSNKEPHGSKTVIFIPRRVKRQSTVWKL